MIAIICFLHFIPVAIMYFPDEVAFLQCKDQLMEYSVCKTFYKDISAMDVCFIKCD